MTKRKRAHTHELSRIDLTLEERDLLLAHADPPDAFDHLPLRAQPHLPMITLELDEEVLDEFMVLFEQAANSAQDMVAAERLGYAYERVGRGLSGDVDPGAHLVRPAATHLGFTALQGRYLAFIYYYGKVNGRPPAEADLQRYFDVTPPTVHAMLKTLQQRRFIARTPGAARSISLLVRPEAIPALT